MNTAQTLRAAAEYIRTHGWRRGWGYDGEPRCVLGAVDSVCRYSDGSSFASRETLSYLAGTYMVGDFNDREIVDEAEAIMFLEIAAELAS